MATQQAKSAHGKKAVRKINKAKPAPDFSKLHSKWAVKLQEGILNSKKPATVACGFEAAKPNVTSKSFERVSDKKVSSTSSSHKKPSNSVRRKSVRKKVDNQSGFEADPSSLAQILGNKPPVESAQPPPRFSAYDVLAIRQKIEDDRRSTYNRMRTPLKSVANILGSYPEVMTPQDTRKSIYDVLSAKHKACALTTHQRKLLNSATGKDTTWAAKLSEKKSSELSGHCDSELKLKLFEDTEDEDLDEALLLKIRMAEQRLERESKELLQQQNEAVNVTYVARPNKDDSNIALDDTSDNIVSLLNDTCNSNYRQPPDKRSAVLPPKVIDQYDKMLPQMSGVARLAATPVHDESVSNLLDNLRLTARPLITPFEHTMDGSPVLAVPQKCQNVSKVMAAQSSNNCTPVLPRIVKVKPIEESKLPELWPKLPELWPVSSPKTPIVPNLAQVKTVSPKKSPCTSKHSPVVSTAENGMEDITGSTVDDHFNSTIIPPTDSSDQLCNTLQCLDRQISKSRRRSAALVADVSMASSELLKQELEQILSQEQLLERRKKEIENKLAAVRSQVHLQSTSTPPIQQLQSVRSNTLTKQEEIITLPTPDIALASMTVDTTLSNEIKRTDNIWGAPLTSTDNSVCIADSSIIAGQVDNFTGGVSFLEGDGDITFMPPPVDLKNMTALRAISTASNNKRRSKNRESINLMAFSPTLCMINEQTDPPSVVNNNLGTQVDSITECKNLGNLVDIAAECSTEVTVVSNTSTVSNIEKLSGSSTKFQPLVCAKPVKNAGTTDISPNIFLACESALGSVTLSPFTPVNRLQRDAQKHSASISPDTPQLQLKLTDTSDCMEDRLPKRNHCFIQQREIKHGGKHSPEDKLLENTKENIDTPCIHHSGGTIKIYTCGGTPECDDTVQVAKPSVASAETPRLFSSLKDKTHKSGKITPSSHKKKNCLDKFTEALLDDEVSIFTCTSVNSSVEERLRPLKDPVATSLLHGDDQHFIPIPVDDLRESQPMEGSAFSLPHS